MVTSNFLNITRRPKKIKALWILLTCVLSMTFYLTLIATGKDDKSKQDSHPVIKWRDIIKDLAPGLPKNCTHLFKGLPKDYYPESYKRQLKDFKQKLRDVLVEKNVVGIEGHSGQLTQQQLFYWMLAKQPHVKTVCEIGFNAGHSALLWLSAKENLTLYSFDINQHRYTQPMAEYLKARFPGRFYIVYGPSLMTVPVVSQLSHFKCDISVVDGAHTKDMAINDVINMRKLSDENVLVVIDDTAKDSRGRRNEVNEALQDIIKRNMAQLIYSCSFHMSSRGFAFLQFKDQQ